MKKRLYAMLGLVVCAVFMFGCDAEPADEDQDNTPKAAELELYNGPADGANTAKLVVHRTVQGTYYFAVDYNGSRNVYICISVTGSDRSPFDRGSGKFADSKYQISQSDRSIITNATSISGFELAFSNGNDPEVTKSFLDKVGEFRAFLKGE